MPLLHERARELCDHARFTGYDVDGGYAELVAADERFCLPLDDSYDDSHAAPLLCAGLIGFRALTMCGDAERLGLYGFGAAAHLIAQVARHQGRRVFAFTRAGDESTQAFAGSLGAEWAGAAMSDRRSSSTRRSSSPPSARWSPRRCAPPPRVAAWCAPGST